MQHTEARANMPQKLLPLLMLIATPALAVDCEQLGTLDTGYTEIVSAGTVAAGAFEPPAGRGRFGGFGQQAYEGLSAFCRVVAISRPAEGSEIGIEVWLPDTGWNGKLQTVGNGGWAGSIGHSTMAGALTDGYAVAATDTGHQGGTPDFLFEHPDKLIDFSHRAVHETAVLAKQVIAAFYERPHERAYFTGCSTGGRQALTAAQRYPEDFDGIVAGAAAYYPSHIHGTQVWIGAISNRSEEARLTGDQFSLLNEASIAACDTIDGVADGVIENPQQCDFDPATLACPAAGGTACLNPEQVETARLAYRGPTDGNGASVFSGLTRGSESGWNTLSGTQPLSIARETYEILVYGDDPDWDWRSFDPVNDIDTAVERIGPLMNSADPDISEFVGHGGKLILYHGWNDSGIPPGGTIRYYDAVSDSLGAELADDNVRLFMVPGMGHCAGGTGTDRFDLIATLDNWIDTDEAPERVEAARIVGGETVRTRPLCAWPAAADYDGNGSTDEAENFSCR